MFPVPANALCSCCCHVPRSHLDRHLVAIAAQQQKGFHKAEEAFDLKSHCVFATGVQCQPGGRPLVLPHPVSVHDDFPAVPLERLHPVLCADAGGVPHRLLGPQGKPDGKNGVLATAMVINPLCRIFNLKVGLEILEKHTSQKSQPVSSDFSLEHKNMFRLVQRWVHIKVKPSYF